MSANMTVVIVVAIIATFLSFIVWLDKRYPSKRHQGGSQ